MLRSALRSALLASVPLTTLALPMPAQAQDAAAEADAPAIIVTGTRRTDRTLADSNVPIDVIGGEQLAASGLGETNKILNALVPSFNFPQPSIADGTDVLRPATLRGLAPDQTLVLVNGKRRHVSALLNINGTIGRGSTAVDMNNIPGLAIERIEVLRDGAASQYGSDAIAGVINVQLKKASSGGRAQVSYGKYITTLPGVPNVTGLQTNNGQPILDPADGRYFLANTDGERKARDGALWTLATNFGFKLGQEGYINLTAEYRDRSGTNRQAFDLRPNYARNATTNAFDPRELTFNRLNFRYGDAETKDYSFFANAGLPLAGAELYAFASYNRRDGESAANWRQQLNGATGTGGANRNYATITPGTTPSLANFTPLTPDGYLPLIQTDYIDYAGTVGLRGDLGGWKSDVSLQYGKNRFDYRVAGTVNASLGTASPSEFDAGGLRYGQFLANLDFSKSFEAGFAKPLSVAFGAEYRREDFQIRPGDPASYAAGPLYAAPLTGSTLAACTTAGGVFNATTNVCSFPGRSAATRAQGFPGIPANAARDVNRNSFAAYVELDTDLVRGLTTTVAGRFERYSDFGTTLNGKLAVRYELVDGFALRGAFSNGFRAPSLQQQFFTTTSTNFISGVAVDILTLGVGDTVARRLGSRDLKPEKSTNLSVGFTANPLRGLSLTVDYYQIKIKDRIVLTENLGASGNGATDTLARSLINDPSIGAVRFFINGLDTTTEGFDAVASYRFNAAGGNWSLSAAYNNNKTSIDRRIVDLGPLAAAPGIVLFGRVEGVRFTDGQPRDKVVLSADGKIGMFGITARSTRYGRVISPNTAVPIANPTSLTELGPDDVNLSPKWITDLELRAEPIGNIELAVGANNLFDIYPDRVPFGPRPANVGGVYPVTQQFLAYSNFSPFGFNGRFLYARVGVKF